MEYEKEAMEEGRGMGNLEASTIIKPKIEISRFWFITTVTALFLAIPPMWPYTYYTLLRFLVTGTSGYIAYQCFKNQKVGWFRTFLIIAIVFNPVVPLPLGKPVWTVVDLAVAIILIIFNRKINPSKKALRPEKKKESVVKSEPVKTLPEEVNEIKPEAVKQGNAIKNFLRGDFPLVKTYWLFWTLPGVIVSYFYQIIGPSYARIILGGGIYFYNGIIYLAIAYHPLVSVAVWRSAGKYSGPKIWKILARVAVVYGAFLWIALLVNTFGSSRYSSEKLEAEVKLTNGSLPMDMGDGITFLKVRTDGKSFSYIYLLRNFNSEEFVQQGLGEKIEEELMKTICDDRGAIPLLRNGIKLEYIYFTNDKKAVAKTDILPENCGF